MGELKREQDDAAAKSAPGAEVTAPVPEPESEAATATAEDSLPADPDFVPPPPSRRTRLVPPDGKPLPWWVRHRGKLHILEWTISAFFIVLAIYYLWLMFFAERPEVSLARPPTKEDFRERLRALPAAAMDPAWKVKSKLGRWRCIVLHHTDTDGGSPEAIDRYHREVKKWPNGLGYHFLIGNGKGMRDGEVAVGRRWTEQLDGSHVDMKESIKVNDYGMAKSVNSNSFCIGVALVGDFEKDLATPAQLASLRSLLTFLRKEYGIGLASIVGHGQVSSKPTKCPGQLFFVDEVILALANP